MEYTVKTLQELVDLMASCERLNLPFVVSRQPREIDKWFGRTDIEMFYVLQVVQFVEEESVTEEE